MQWAEAAGAGAIVGGAVRGGVVGTQLAGSQLGGSGGANLPPSPPGSDGAESMRQIRERISLIENAVSKGFISVDDALQIGVSGESRRERLDSAIAEIQRLQELESSLADQSDRSFAEQQVPRDEQARLDAESDRQFAEQQAAGIQVDESGEVVPKTSAIDMDREFAARMAAQGGGVMTADTVSPQPNAPAVDPFSGQQQTTQRPDVVPPVSNEQPGTSSLTPEQQVESDRKFAEQKAAERQSSQVEAPEVPVVSSPEQHAALPMYGVYETAFRGERKFSVKEFENRGAGDALFDSLEEANKYSLRAARSNQERVSREQKDKTDQELAVTKQQDYEDSFSGFLSTDPKTKGRQLKVLGSSRRYNEKVVAIKDLIEQKVAGGAVVNASGQLESPDGGYLGSDKITKIGIDYARHLILEAKVKSAIQGKKGIEESEVAAPAKTKRVFAVMTSDGVVHSDPNAKMHYDVIETLGLDPNDIIDGGFIEDGKYRMSMSDGGYAATEGEPEHVAVVRKFADDYNAKVERQPSPQEQERDKTRKGGIRKAIEDNGGYEKNSADDVDAIRNKLYDGADTPTGTEIRSVMDEMKVEAGRKLESEQQKPTERNMPSYRDWRFRSTARNSGKIVPNKVGVKFLPDQMQSIVKWAKSEGYSVSNVTPTGINVSDQKTLNRLDIAMYGAEGVKAEASKAASQRRKEESRKADEERKAKADGRESASWISSTFGDVINDYNRNALSDYIEGVTEKFDGSVSANWKDGLEKIGALSPESKIDWGKVRDAYADARPAEQPTTEPTETVTAPTEPQAPSKLLDKLESIEELRAVLENWSADDKRPKNSYSLNELIDLARSRLEDFKLESGNELAEDLDGQNGEDARKYAIKQKRQIKDWIKKAESESTLGELEGNREFSESFVTIVADDVSKIRRQDVYRLLSEVPSERAGYFENWLIKRRPDLAEEVNNVSSELLAERSQQEGKSETQPEGEMSVEDFVKAFVGAKQVPLQRAAEAAPGAVQVSQETEYSDIKQHEPGIVRTIRAEMGGKSLLLEQEKNRFNWSIRELDSEDDIVSGIADLKRAKAISGRIFLGTFDKDADLRFSLKDASSLAYSNQRLAGLWSITTAENLAATLNATGYYTDGRVLLKVSGKDRDAILKKAGTSGSGRVLNIDSVVAPSKDLSGYSDNEMSVVGYRGGDASERTVMLKNKTGHYVILNKAYHDTVVKRHPSAKIWASIPPQELHHHKQ
jgi:hypothetical protein